MTIWAAYSVNAQWNCGSLEVGKKADFVILENDIMKCNFQQVRKNKVIATFIGGRKVFGK